MESKIDTKNELKYKPKKKNWLQKQEKCRVRVNKQETSLKCN